MCTATTRDTLAAAPNSVDPVQAATASWQGGTFARTEVVMRCTAAARRRRWAP
jgi:hypothetical protein